MAEPILGYYRYATLATASYVRMGSRPLTGPEFARQATLLQQGGGRLPTSLSAALFNPANANAPRWNILRYYGSDAPEFAGDISGFGATLFQNSANGEKVLAMRGTEPAQDGLVDLLGADIGQIGILGLALTQVVSMVNLIQRMRGAKDQPVLQVKISASLLPSEGALTVFGVPPMFLTFSRYEGRGIGGIEPGEKVKVTGHSLGGHLAYMAARLFPDVVDPQAHIFNAAGYDPLAADFIAAGGPLALTAVAAAKTYLMREFGFAAVGVSAVANQLTDSALYAIATTLRGAEPGLGTSEVIHVRSEDLAPGDDLSLVAGKLTAAEKYGAAIDVPTEHNNHTIEPLADALALQALVEPWQGAIFDRDDLIRVLDASSNERTRSYEEFAEGLFRLAIKGGRFLDEAGQQNAGDKLPTSDESTSVPMPRIAKGEIGARNAFHDAILRTRDALKDRTGLQIRDLSGLQASTIASLGRDGDLDSVAYRYALRSLNPFALLGPADLYGPHDTDERLELHDLVGGSGAISDIWIQDRAAFLCWKSARNTADIVDGAAVRRTDNEAQSYVFADRAIKNLQGQELTLRVVGKNPFQQNDPMQIVFGADQTDFTEELFGSAYSDHLFGEGGDDVLVGGFGNDYLEGGRGADTYAYLTGHGEDTILDVDGLGMILFDGEQLRSGERIGPYQWRYVSDFGREFFYWLRNEKDSSQGLTITAANTAGSIHIRGYRDGALGIALPEFTADPRPDGDMEAGTGGNDVLRHPFQPVKLGLAGDDILYGHADFWLEGGPGNDWLPYEYSSGEPARGFIAFGGQGNDFAHGSAYDDALHAEDAAEFDALVDGRNSPEGGPEREVLFGGAGDDVVAGGRGNDWIAGGIGSDVLYGEAGNDIISGAGEIFMGDAIGQAALDPQVQTFFNVHTSGRFDQTHPGILINLPSRISDYGISPGLLGTIAREGLDEHGWRDGADLIFAGAGNDEAWGGHGDDTIAGEAGDDLLLGEAENDLLDGGDGDDRLMGGAGNDVLIGGPGADILEGGPGDDIYLIDAGDTVRDTEGRNRIRFDSSVRREDLRATQSGTTLLLTGVASSVLTIENGFSGAVMEVGVEYASFTFGEFLSSIAADDLVVQGSGGDEGVFGASGNDRIIAGRGADVIDGGAGDDVYVFNLGDGFDVVTDFEGVDIVEFGTGIRAADVSVGVHFNFMTGGYDMHVSYGPGDTIAIGNGHTGMISEYRFDDGTILPHVDMVARDTQGFSLAGTEGSDLLFGGGGNDSLIGFAGDDVLVARAGDDFLSGQESDDIMDGGDGNDLLEDDAGNDVLRGGPGNDALRAGNGADVLVGGAGADRLEGGEGNDTYVLEAGDGADILDDIAGANAIRFGDGITPDSIAASILNATDGGIYLSLQYGASDYLLVRQDPLRPGASEAAFSFAGGEMLTQGELIARTLSSPLDYVAGANPILIYGSRFDDRVLASEQSDFVDGGDGDDLLQGEGGNDVLIGGAGNDALLGGAGDDTLAGGSGSDTYALRRGMGRDTVVEDAADPAVNTLRLGTEVTLADLSADRRDDSLYLHVRNTRDGVIIEGYFATGAGAWRVESSDGTLTPLADVLAGLPQAARAVNVAAAYEQFLERARAVYASALYGAGWTLGADGRFHLETTFDGTYFSRHGVQNLGFGTVAETAGEASFTRQSAPVLLTGQTFSESLTSQTVQVLDTSNSRVVPLPDGGNAYRPGSQPAVQADIDEILRSGASGILLPGNVVPIYDGQLIARPFSADPTPQQRITALATYGGGGAPIHTTQTITHVHHEASATWEMQIADIAGGDSEDQIDGGAGFSLVDGGAGHDILRAEGGIYLPNAVLRIDAIPGALLYGNSGDDELHGTAFDDVLIGGSGNDEMRGGDGNDTYLIFSGDGRDLIVDDGETIAGFARENVLELPEGVALGELSASHEELVVASRYRLPTNAGGVSVSSTMLLSLHNTLLLSWDGGSVRIVLPHTEQDAGTGIDFVRFADGSSASMAQVFALAGGAPEIDPHDRDNTETGITYGGGGNDLLHGGRIVGGRGRDTLIGTAFDDQLYGAELVEETHATLTGGASALSTLWDEGNEYRGGAGNDVLFATAGSDIFHYESGDGDDIVTDMLHDRTFIYGYGGPIGSADHSLPHWQDPTAVQAAHQALLFSNTDTLKFGAGIAPQDVRFYRRRFENNEDLVLDVGTGSVCFENWFKAEINQLARVEFANSTVWDAGAAASRAAVAPLLVRGTEFDDFLFGGPDNESLQGGDGDDTYFISPGGGSDAIVDNGGYDTLVLGVDPGEITLGLGSLRIRIGAGGDEVRLENFDPDDALAASDIELFRFADGTELAYADLVGRGFDLLGTAGDDTISGTNLADRVDGGAGDDTLAGGMGNDTYRFGVSSGKDVIQEAASTADVDTLEILAGASNVTVTREADSIVVSLEGSADRVAIEWFGNLYARIENVTFADGTLWDASMLEANIQSEADSAPEVANAIADQQAFEDVPVTYVLPADAFSDPDGDALSYGIEVLPPWLSFDPDSRTFSGTPRNADVGSYPVEVVATDSGGLSARDEFALTVFNVNDAPVVAQPLPDRVFDAGLPFVFSVPAQTFGDEDAGDSLALAAGFFGGGALPAWLRFDPGSGTFSGKPKAADIGISRLAVTATDAAGASATADFALIVRSAADAAVSGGRGDDFLYGNTGDETLKAKGGNDYLYGDAGDDALVGGSGDDILQGGAGDDVLRGGSGQNLLDGGSGNDVIYGGQASSFIAGGLGDDVLHVGRGSDVIAFNLGDGVDTVYGGRDGGNTLSLGGGIVYDDLSLSKRGKDLVVSIGTADKVVLKNWYAGMKSVENLQLVGSAGVDTFDFLGLARSFDAARAASPGVSSWALTNALLQWHLAHSDDEALGGDLAHWYAKNRGLAGISVQAAQQVIEAPGFGLDAQSLRPFEGLREGFAKLA